MKSTTTTTTSTGVSCTEIKILVAPPPVFGKHIPPFESVALVPGSKTVTTTLCLGRADGGLVADKFDLDKDQVLALLLRLAYEYNSFLDKVPVRVPPRDSSYPLRVIFGLNEAGFLCYEVVER